MANFDGVFDLILYMWNYFIGVLFDFVISYKGTSIRLLWFYFSLIVASIFFKYFFVLPSKNSSVSERIKPNDDGE